MSPETLAKIEKEAEEKYPYYRDELGDINPADEYNTEQYAQRAAYIAGATRYAERVEELEKTLGYAKEDAQPIIKEHDELRVEISALKKKLIKIQKRCNDLIIQNQENEDFEKGIRYAAVEINEAQL